MKWIALIILFAVSYSCSSPSKEPKINLSDEIARKTSAEESLRLSARTYYGFARDNESMYEMRKMGAGRKSSSPVSREQYQKTLNAGAVPAADQDEQYRLYVQSFDPQFWAEKMRTNDSIASLKRQQADSIRRIVDSLRLLLPKNQPPS